MSTPQIQYLQYLSKRNRFQPTSSLLYLYTPSILFYILKFLIRSISAL